MEQYISKSDLVAEIEKRIENLYPKVGQGMVVTKILKDHYEDFLSFLDTLEVKEYKLPNPRFPHLDNIVDKVFGIGNLESFEYEEAEQLVLLAKEELLKDLEVKEVNYNNGWIDCSIQMPQETKQTSDTLQGHREWTESDMVLVWDSMYGCSVDATKKWQVDV